APYLSNQRPSAKELLRLRFIRNARRSPKLLERIRERPKYHIKEDEESPRSGHREFEDGSGTVKVTRNLKDEGTSRASPGRTLKNDGWDFSTTASPGTGTVRSSVKPPQVAGAREKIFEVSSHASPKKTAVKRNPWSSTSGSAVQESYLESSHFKEASEQHDNEVEDDYLEDGHLLGSGSGTFVLRSPRGIKTSSFFNDQSSMANNRYASFEDVSTSGTVVLRGQSDELDTPRTPKSRLGIQEKSSSASLEDSETNLAEAKAAMQAGLRKGNARERSALGKLKKDGQEHKVTEQPTSSPASSRSSREYFDAQKALPLSRQASEQDITTLAAAAASPALSSLLIPSMKEAVGDESEGSAVRALVDSLVYLERMKPGLCEVIVSKLLQRLGSSKESSLVGLQELASRVFTKNIVVPVETENANVEAMNKKKQADLSANANLSPLAKFLLTRWQGQVARDLNPF
ncbi:kinase superfamily protein, partial [Thalictrum thalictroides]